MNGNAAVGLHHDKAQCFGQSRLEAAGVFHGATSHYQSHVTILADEGGEQGNVSFLVLKAVCCGLAECPNWAEIAGLALAETFRSP